MRSITAFAPAVYRETPARSAATRAGGGGIRRFRIFLFCFILLTLDFFIIEASCIFLLFSSFSFGERNEEGEWW